MTLRIFWGESIQSNPVYTDYPVPSGFYDYQVEIRHTFWDDGGGINAFWTDKIITGVVLERGERIGPALVRHQDLTWS